MEDRLLHEIARLALEKLGATSARIIDHAVEVR